MKRAVVGLEVVLLVALASPAAASEPEALGSLQVKNAAVLELDRHALRA